MGKYQPSLAYKWLDGYGDETVGQVTHALASRFTHDFLCSHPERPEQISFSQSESAQGISEVTRNTIDVYFQEIAKAFYTEMESEHHPRLFMEYPVKTNQFGPNIGVGRVDAFVLSDQKLTVFELKTGIAKIPNCNQLALYALAIINDFRLPEDMVVELKLIQPRTERKITSNYSAGRLREELWRLNDYQKISKLLDGKINERMYLVSEKSKPDTDQPDQ